MANHKGNYIKQSVATHQEKDDYTQVVFQLQRKGKFLNNGNISIFLKPVRYF